MQSDQSQTTQSFTVSSSEGGAIVDTSRFRDIGTMVVEPKRTGKPWPREKLDLHVAQRIRENVQISTMIEHELDDGDTHHVLRDRGEHYLWSVILEAIGDAGWQVCSGDCL